MALTQNDLQAIGAAIDQKLQPIRNDIKAISSELQPIRNDIKAISSELQPIRNELRAVGSVIDQKLKPIKKDIREIKKTVETTAKLLDLEQMRQRKQIKRIEENLDLPSYS